MRRRLFQGTMMVFMGMGVLAVLAGAMMNTPVSEAAGVTLTGETWTPTMSPPARLIGPKFAKGLEEATGGAVKTNWHTASALGPVPELYTRLVQGIIDWGQFNIGYTPGIFLMSEMFELPVQFSSEELFTKAMIEMYKKGYLDKDFEKVKFIFYHAIGPYQLWSNVKITSVEELGGKKLRCPSPTYVAASKALGAVPVSIPAGEIYTALQKGIIDGTWACGDMAVAFKIGEIAKYVIMTNLGSTTQTYAMHKTPYKALPEAGKQYIEDNWEELSLYGARTFHEYNEKGFASARKNNVEIVEWSEAELKKMNQMVSPVFSAWVDNVEAKGLPGKKALTDFYQALEKLGVKEAFVLPQ
jgi:TRAP-type C4-dicarboxylate transport system substrate-binding protein